MARIRGLLNVNNKLVNGKRKIYGKLFYIQPQAGPDLDNERP